MTGTLYLVATPIGNLEDITLRGLRLLKEVDLIACEDTRRTARLLAHYGIRTHRLSFHEHNEASRTQEITAALRQGRNIALVSDAGTPLVSDPGLRLVAACRREGIPVIPVPGASAATTALAASGLPADSFHFAGFLPARPAARRRRLNALATETATLLFYEAPHRIVRTLKEMSDTLGPRPACLAREMTKVHEEWITGSLEDIREALRLRPAILGEITLVVAGAQSPAVDRNWPSSIAEHLEKEMSATGAGRMEALKNVARQRGIRRREAYRLLLEESCGKREP